MKYHANACWIILLLLYGISSSAIITVDNKSPYAGQYRTLQEAHDAASAGDSIYVSPSQTKYYGIFVTKPLSFIGVGFNLALAIGGSYTTTTSIANTMEFRAGSEGSLLEGFDGSFVVLITNTSNVTIKRNKLSDLLTNSSSDCAVIQNDIVNLNLQMGTSNLLINNNLIINKNGNAYGNYPALSGGTDLNIINNIIINAFGYTLQPDNSQIINNIILPGTISGSNNTIRYNIFESAWPTTFGNQSQVDPNTVFVDYANNNFHLRPGSPALGAGENGVDIGIYGGDAPYIDGGFPSLPSILQLKGDLVAAPGTGLNVQFKAKSSR